MISSASYVTLLLLYTIVQYCTLVFVADDATMNEKG